MGTHTRRTAERIHRALSEEIADLDDDRLGFVTVTGVDVTPDLSRARIRFTVLGDEPVRASSAEALEESRTLLASQLAARVRMRRTPRLEFVYDDSTDHAMRIHDLLEAAQPGS